MITFLRHVSLRTNSSNSCVDFCSDASSNVYRNRLFDSLRKYDEYMMNNLVWVITGHIFRESRDSELDELEFMGELEFVKAESAKNGTTTQATSDKIIKLEPSEDEALPFEEISSPILSFEKHGTVQFPEEFEKRSKIKSNTKTEEKSKTESHVKPEFRQETKQKIKTEPKEHSPIHLQSPHRDRRTILEDQLRGLVALWQEKGRALFFNWGLFDERLDTDSADSWLTINPSEKLKESSGLFDYLKSRQTKLRSVRLGSLI